MPPKTSKLMFLPSPLFIFLGVHFNTSYEALKSEISTVLKVFAHGVESFVGDPENEDLPLSTALSCEGLGEGAKWASGERFYRYLRNVSIDIDSGPGKPPLEFGQDGTLKSVELQIMNLRPGPTDRLLVWEQVSPTTLHYAYLCNQNLELPIYPQICSTASM
jgi:ionotropic glutamate receptor NMDA 2B